MLAKLRLDQTALYEQAIAAYEVSKMICAFVEGREHVLSIGAEQGDISGWDDFILQNGLNEYTHLQIKRQQTDFSPLNDCIKNGTSRLTPLDNSMQSLANWVKSHNGSTNVSKRHFRLCLPSDGLFIKRGLELRNLRDFRTLHINPTTTAQGLQNLQNSNDSNAINIFNWLTTWCQFEDWDHILKALLSLTITDDGIEADLDLRSTTELARIFRSPGSVLARIKSYIQHNSAYTGNISPRQLLFEFKNDLLVSQRTWTQIENTNGNWEISGIHDLEDNLEIERPLITVPLLWSNERNRILKINVAQIITSLAPIHESIFQLAIHLDGNVNGLCANWEGWKVCIENKIGGTFGVLENDFESVRISNNNDSFIASDGKIMSTSGECDTFASEMNNQMVKKTWSLVSEKIEFRISQMETTHSPELRNAVEARWEIWRQIITRDESILIPLLKKIVHPNAEGEEILGQLRIGPKTKLLIADAVFTCLIISVALGSIDGEIMKTEDGLSIGVIGLNWWSGPAGKTKKIRRIDEEESIGDLIGKESYDILILSQSEQPEGEIYKESISDSVNIDHSLATGNNPKILITKNRIFNSILNKGSIDELQNYLKQKLKNYTESLSETLNNNIS